MSVARKRLNMRCSEHPKMGNIASLHRKQFIMKICIILHRSRESQGKTCGTQIGIPNVKSCPVKTDEAVHGLE